MRVDKFLWCIRIFKSRSLSASHCKAGKVFISEEVVKPAREIHEGQVITVRKAHINYSYKVLSFPKSRVGAKLVPEYSLDVTTKVELEKLEMMKLSSRFERQKGMGRPTKRERRDINKFRDDES